MARKPLTDAERQHKRAAILDCAAGLIGTRGFDSTSMEDIASAAGLSTGALYLYFSGKTDIFADLYEQALCRLEDAFNDALRLPVPDVRTQLCLLMYSYINFHRSHGALYRILTDSSAEKHLPAEAAERLGAHSLRLLKMLEAPLIDGVLHGAVKPCDTFQTIVLLMGMLDGVFSLPDRFYASDIGCDAQAYFAAAMDVILNGVFVK